MKSCQYHRRNMTCCCPNAVGWAADTPSYTLITWAPPPTQRAHHTGVRFRAVHHTASLPPAELGFVKEKPDARPTNAAVFALTTPVCRGLSNLFEHLASHSSSSQVYHTVNDSKGLYTVERFHDTELPTYQCLSRVYCQSVPKIQGGTEQ